jgi:hypothetical protein
MLRYVRVLLLHTNHISRCDNIGSLVNLEILNLSSNKLDMLPDARVFACLPRLAVRGAFKPLFCFNFLCSVYFLALPPILMVKLVCRCSN